MCRSIARTELLGKSQMTLPDINNVLSFKGLVFHLTTLNCEVYLVLIIKVKQCRYRPGVAQKVPGS